MLIAPKSKQIQVMYSILLCHMRLEVVKSKFLHEGPVYHDLLLGLSKSSNDNLKLFEQIFH